MMNTTKIVGVELVEGGSQNGNTIIRVLSGALRPEQWALVLADLARTIAKDATGAPMSGEATAESSDEVGYLKVLVAYFMADMIDPKSSVKYRPALQAVDTDPEPA